MLGRRKKLRESFIRKFGVGCSAQSIERTKNKINLIARLHKELEGRSTENFIDDITWEDLQMDDVFATVNHTNSFIGEQYLYHRMHRTDKPHEKFEHMVALVTSDEKLRLDVLERLASIGKGRNECYYLASFLMRADAWKMNHMWLIHLMQALLVIVIVIGFLSGVDYVFIALLPIVMINMMIYFYTKNRYEAFLFSLGTLKEIIGMGTFLSERSVAAALELPEEMSQLLQELRPLSRQIMGWTGRKNSVLYGDLAAILSDYFYGITLLDVCVFNHIVKVIDGKQDKILKLLEYIGELDVCISIASYRRSIAKYCIPQIGNTEHIACEYLVHPLIKTPVGNDFHLEDRAIITGGNAAGKSTFLKALAINMILAKSINTCTATSFHMPDLFVMTSMALRDDVISGESYYIREAKRIKQMLEQTDKRSLFIVDEMLKGTNTFERVAASIAILSYLSETGHFVIVATHDPQLGDALSSYKRFYFDSVISNESIFFDYKIHKGVGGKTNAIALLSLLHYPEAIIEQSRKELAKYHAD